MALSAAQQALKLFKKLLGKSSTGLAFDFYEEAFNGRPAVLPSQVWQEADDIPSTAPGATAGVVEYFVDQVLTAVGGTSNAFQHANLVDAIPFNFGDGTSYNYAVKDSMGSTIPFGQGDWVVDPDTGTLTFFGTVPANMPPTITYHKYVGTKGVGSGSGGGGGSGNTGWSLPPSGGPMEDWVNGIAVLDFSNVGDQIAYREIEVPADYNAGDAVTMTGLLFAISVTSGKVKFRITTYLIRAGTTVLGALTGEVSVNTEVTVAAVGSEISAVGDIQLNDGAGEIAGVPIAAGDRLLCALDRHVAGESSVAAADARLIRYTGVPTFS